MKLYSSYFFFFQCTFKNYLSKADEWISFLSMNKALYHGLSEFPYLRRQSRACKKTWGARSWCLCRIWIISSVTPIDVRSLPLLQVVTRTPPSRWQIWRKDPLPLHTAPSCWQIWRKDPLPLHTAPTFVVGVWGSGDSSVIRAPDSWVKGRGFESLQEQRENFILQCRLSVPVLISVSVPPPLYSSRAQSFCRMCRWLVTAEKKHAPYVCGFAWSDTVHGCMVYTELAPRREQFHVAPAMPAL